MTAGWLVYQDPSYPVTAMLIPVASLVWPQWSQRQERPNGRYQLSFKYLSHNTFCFLLCDCIGPSDSSLSSEVDSSVLDVSDSLSAELSITPHD